MDDNELKNMDYRLRKLEELVEKLRKKVDNVEAETQAIKRSLPSPSY